MDVLVVGGGSSGLGAALALHWLGHRVQLLAPADHPSQNHGLFLASNGVALLRVLGVDLEPGEPLRRMAVRGGGGRVLVDLDLGRLTPEESPCRAVHSQALHHAMWRALPRNVERVALRAVGVEDNRVIAEDGKRYSGEVVVFADGVGSLLRPTLLGEEPAGPTNLNVRTWLSPDPLDGAWDAVERLGEGWRWSGLGMPGGGSAHHLYSKTTGTDDSELPDAFSRAGGPGMGEWERAQSSTPRRLWALERPVWGRRSMVFIGDAAHGKIPILGQGIAQGLEDAAWLAILLGDPEGATNLASRLERQRGERVDQLIAQSHKLSDISQVQGGFSGLLRDLAAEAIPRFHYGERLQQLWAPGLELARTLGQRRFLRSN
jgi:FAD-dependent urate hydroxylase